MRISTLSQLRCPSASGADPHHSCAGELEVGSADRTLDSNEIHTGRLICKSCRRVYFILAGVALLVADPYDYLMTHAKGVSKLVTVDELPEEFRSDFEAALEEFQVEHIEEDQESDRVNSLYLLTHYLRAGSDPNGEWWKPLAGAASPLIDELIRKYWDQGPAAQVAAWVREFGARAPFKSVLELGCGVGGLHRALKGSYDSYLGVDASFASVALARHLALGAPYPGDFRIPEDLLRAPLSRRIELTPRVSPDQRARVDFIVSDSLNPGVAAGWDLIVSMNMMDNIVDPLRLPELEAQLLSLGGLTIQSCPYIWHESIAAELRAKVPPELQGESAKVVEWIYQNAGFSIAKSLEHVPWLFFKHVRQLEIYSAHLFAARRAAN